MAQRSETQTPQAPEKWQKYELLEVFGLLPIGYLNDTIRRYTWANRNALLADLTAIIRKLEDVQFCVVKLVPQKLSYLLPNYRIHNPSEIKELERIFEHDSSEFDEVWFCLTLIDRQHFSVAGRIVVDRRSGDAAQTIEQVWRCSPRLLETIDDRFPFPYLRAVRPNWGWSPEIKKVVLPVGSGFSKTQLMEEFGRSLMYMYPHRDRIIDFENFLFECGCDAISLEYKIERNTLRFIDWDTHQDRHVLRRWSERAQGDSS